jgi:hypothetical protein
MRNLELLVLVAFIAIAVTSCGAGCYNCTGITSDLRVCKDDFQNDNDFNAYIREYKEQGGECEE